MAHDKQQSLSEVTTGVGQADSATQEHESFSSGARAALVNRTHRVVRERAEQMQAKRNSSRELVVPLLVCSVLLLMMSYAMWAFFASGTVTVGDLEQEAGKLLDGRMLDTGGTISILFFWFLPVSAVALGTILFQRSRRRGDGEVTR